MRTSRRVHLWLPAELEAGLAAFARGHGLGLAPAMRVLLAQGLVAGVPGGRHPDSPAALASLLAAEHAVLMVASVLPEGQRKARELAAQAAAAAEERLALFKEPTP